MQRHPLVVALGLGCLAVWFQPSAAARAATVTTASGSSGTATGSRTAVPSGTTALPATAAMPPTSLVPGSAASTASPAVPGPSAVPGSPTFPSLWGAPPAPAARSVGGWVPDGKGRGVYRLDAPAIRLPDATAASGNGISYHGGAVMLGTTHVYFIWYGNWASSSATTILADWAKSLGGSSYFSINTTYYDGSNRKVSNSVTFGGAVFDNYSLGSTLSDNSIYTIVATAIANGSLPLDANGVYFVLTSADVAETSGFCTQYCGWHSSATFNNVSSQFAFVGNTVACPFACEGSPGNHPNGNEGADGMASIMTHELEESVTDPNGDAWYDNGGNENGDLCNFNFGSHVYGTANGSIANVQLGPRNFLLQEDWVNASGGYCSIGLPQNTRYYTVPPCRLVDTRWPAGPTGGPILQPGQDRTFALAGACGIPASAQALSVNVTVTQPASAGLLALTAADQQPAGTSTINFRAGRTIANNAILRLSGEGSGSIDVLASTLGTVHFLLDVNGYFQ
jgi:hypothetical protein